MSDAYAAIAKICLTDKCIDNNTIAVPVSGSRFFEYFFDFFLMGSVEFKSNATVTLRHDVIVCILKEKYDAWKQTGCSIMDA